MNPTDRMRLRAQITNINNRLPKWRTWFPNEDSEVEISRRELLLLKDAAELWLAATDSGGIIAPLATLTRVKDASDRLIASQISGNLERQTVEIPRKMIFEVQNAMTAAN